jgi:ABC-2 type transport system permease protein
MKLLAIIRNEFWQRRRSILFWTIGIMALIAVDMLLYSEIKQESAQINDVYNSLPATVKAMFADTTDFMSAAGYLSIRVYYLLLPLLLTIYTITLGSGLIGKEEQQGTLELLLARPVSRLKLLLGKALAGAGILLCMLLAALVTALACYAAVGFPGVSAVSIALVTVDAFVLGTLFGAVALCLGCLEKPWRTLAAPLAALIAFGGYLLASLEGTASWLIWPARLLPYHYYYPSSILNGQSHGLKVMAGYVAVGLALFVAGWLGFRRRDIG